MAGIGKVTVYVISALEHDVMQQANKKMTSWQTSQAIVKKGKSNTDQLPDKSDQVTRESSWSGIVQCLMLEIRP